MSIYYYLDACPLLRWAEKCAGETNPRCVAIGEELEKIIESEGNITAI